MVQFIYKFFNKKVKHNVLIIKTIPKTLEDALTAFNWKIGEQRKNYGKNHFFIWDEDKYEILVNNFNYYLNNIKN